MRWLVGGLAALAGAGCGASEPAPVAVDADAVDLIVDLHLADARAAQSSDASRRAALSDSLRAAVLRARDLTPEALARRERAWADEPDIALAHYDSAEALLRTERIPVTP